MHRRNFLQSAALAAAAAPRLFAGTRIPTRPLGKTGVNVSMIGLGGYDLGMPRDEKEAVRMMDKALDLGATFFDNAHSYHEGVSEERMGKVIAGSAKRQKLFVMTKTTKRDAEGAGKELDDSLRRLRTDYLDLWNVHSIANYKEVEQLFAPGGAMEVFEKAKKEGKARFIGFTGHTDPQVHLALLERYNWDTVMMPINPADKHWHSFQNQVLPRALEKKCGILGFKTLSRGRALTRAYTVAEALRYTWSLPVSVLISGMDRSEFLDTNLDLAMKFEPMSAAEKESLLNRIKPTAGQDIEYYKKVVPRA